MKPKVFGILGTTNTGKTFSAFKKMLDYDNGVIGFPLRLLARENYEKGIKEIGYKNVALITGEEKIIPSNARYFFCTVEAMPEKKFEFLAIDEIQLATNIERGHNFTQKILKSRGSKETHFLGSKSVESILKNLIPEIIIKKKERFSKLSFYGYKNIVRLPPRSAVIAFSQIDVYSIAEKLKRFKGGVSIITGSLSPEARNKQVKLYENGEVDYLVATDAIGLGLNLSIKYIFFSSLIKFDGLRKRYLMQDEIAQIAGRAGRFKDNGFFGITESLKKIDEEIIDYVENYKSKDISFFYWRNSQLKFNNIENLKKSIQKKSNNKVLRLIKDSTDFLCMKHLLQTTNLENYLNSISEIKKFWEICSIPNYTKTLIEFHTQLLSLVIDFLLIKKKKIPYLFVAQQLKKISVADNKISIINSKISQIRIWAYISFKKGWIEEEKFFQKEIKKIENNLSSKLHECLIKKFVDERVSILHNSKNFEDRFNLNIKKRTFFLNKKKICELRGFRIFFEKDLLTKKKEFFFQKVLKKKLKEITQNIVNEFINIEFKDLTFDRLGNIYWLTSVVGKFKKGSDIFYPKIELYVDFNFSIKQKELLIKKLNNYLTFLIRTKLSYYYEIKTRLKVPSNSNSLRAIGYALCENFGYCDKKKFGKYFSSLTKAEFVFLKELGIVNGNKFIYVKKIDQIGKEFSLMLLSVNYKFDVGKEISKKFLVEKKESYLINIPSFIREKIGFHEIKVLNKIFLVHFSIYEKLINSTYFHKKNKIPLSKSLKINCDNNDFFLKNFFRERLIHLK